MLPGGLGRGKVGLAEEVEHELGLVEYLVPQEFWGCSGHTCKNREKVGFESFDCAFCCVAVVHFGGGNLEGCFTLFFNFEFVCCAVFIIKYLEVEVVAIILEAVHNTVG